MKKVFTLSSIALLATTGFTQIGPTPYLQSSDSPWAALIGNPGFYLEDFEDNALNTPGVTSDFGNPFGPSGIGDSVDGDDGNVDGSGTAGRSFFTGNAAQGIRFTFNSTILGGLPTHAGLVWTDGQIAGTTRFEAFDGSGASLGVITGNHADGNFGGGTAEDRFYGWVNAGGIGSIKMTHSGGGGLEVDHLQYGTVPEPASMLAMGIGLIAIMARRRRSN
jgi:hypothetical protein